MAPVTGGTYAFEYDALNRLSSRYNWHYRTRYTYADGANAGETTTQVSQISFETRTGGPSFTPFSIQYAYDALGNISSVSSTGRSDLEAAYTYDVQGQLTKEIRGGDTYEYIYDTYGNIRSVEKNDAVIHTYTYGDTNWLDKLTAFDNHPITYDEIGNPANWYNTKAWTALTWQNGRQLASITDGTTAISFTYDVAGIRDSKTVGTTTYNYLTQNGQVVRQTWGSNVMDFIYDNQSRPYALVYNGTTYYYLLNLQGDVIGIITQAGVSVATYTYDAWGAIISKSGSLADVNPIRYRGYYYDQETGMYYLQSRYYDPLVKRFVNADSLASTGQAFVGYNMFAYCSNNPIILRDSSGGVSETALALGAKLLEAGLIGAGTGAVFGAVEALLAGESVLEGIRSGAGEGFVTGVIGSISIPWAIGTGAVSSAWSYLKSSEDVSIAGFFISLGVGGTAGYLSGALGSKSGDLITECAWNYIITLGAEALGGMGTIVADYYSPDIQPNAPTVYVPETPPQPGPHPNTNPTVSQPATTVVTKPTPYFNPRINPGGRREEIL